MLCAYLCALYSYSVFTVNAVEEHKAHDCSSTAFTVRVLMSTRHKQKEIRGKQVKKVRIFNNFMAKFGKRISKIMVIQTPIIMLTHQNRDNFPDIEKLNLKRLFGLNPLFDKPFFRFLFSKQFIIFLTL